MSKPEHQNLSMLIRAFRHVSGCALPMAALLACFLSTGCLSVPVKAKPIILGPTGNTTQEDPTQIQPGTTTREKFLHEWGWTDAHVKAETLFVGQVKRSTTNSVQTLGWVPIHGERDWDTDILFAEFDNHGFVSKVYFVSSSKLGREVAIWLDHNPQPPLDLTTPLELDNGFVVLHPDSLEIRARREANGSIRLGTGQLRNFHSCGAAFCMHVLGKPRSRSSLELDLSVADSFTFVRYLKQVAPAALPSARSDSH